MHNFFFLRCRPWTPPHSRIKKAELRRLMLYIVLVLFFFLRHSTSICILISFHVFYFLPRSPIYTFLLIIPCIWNDSFQLITLDELHCILNVIFLMRSVFCSFFLSFHSICESIERLWIFFPHNTITMVCALRMKSYENCEWRITKH